MIRQRAEYLKSELFFLDKMLREPLLQLRTQTYRIMKADLIDFSNDDVRNLPSFNNDQNTRREKLADML